MRLSNEEIKNEAFQIVESEIAAYDEALFFITEDVAFSMRPLIRKLRRNYWGLFDKDKTDKTTGKDNFWVPLTRLIVDSVRKNADIDSKNTNVIAKRGKKFGISALIRSFIRGWAERTYFGEVLNRTILTICIDGTAVWKTLPMSRNGKQVINRTDVDLLNVYIDPTADNIQSAYRFTERVIMKPSDIAAMDWMDNENITGQKNLHKIEKDLRHSYETGSYQDVYEMWGLVPEYLITGQKYKRKENKNVEARIVISGIQTGDKRVHVIERNTTKDSEGNIIKPYEEAWYIKVPGRWYGVGPAEMVMNLQDWINRVVNLRIKKNTHAALGLFKVRNNAGITQQQLSNLVSSGVIKVNNMDDLDNFRVDEAGQGSYEDEQTAKNWAFEVTSTNAAVRGAPLPASATATSSVIEDRNSKSAFVLVKESVGLFMERWFNRHYMPHLPKLMRQEQTLRMFSDTSDIKRVRKELVASMTMAKLRKSKNVPSEQEVIDQMNKLEQKMIEDGDLFFDQLKENIANQYETRFIFTNEKIDVGVTTRNLIDLAQLLPPEAGQARNDFVAQALDLLNLEVPASLQQDPVQPTRQEQERQARRQREQGAPTELGENLQANVQQVNEVTAQ